MVKVYITRNLKTYTNGIFEISLRGENIKDIIENLLEKHNGLKNFIYTNEDKLSDYIKIYLNEREIRNLNNLDTKVYQDDKIILFQAI
ncbi:hypothetical protein CRU87_03250 [Aliarcobacter trophiarum LMG 25534]|uniref:ThiS family protein n=1 Tax=Aliarcobacter trophiarum LMG 25534 TaxID=1032241 RepID=A0AAD0VMT8_9BACT|nr:MoaD/ThiS family protein [Aliarcobacter trophiarum]AXK49773.1 ThiS family protein [Aliarcobacter trophiarum LMG 25534]RXI28095.1 hypothetical protein CRU89_02605 [Aliarcobacter trophiarum]RXJ92451.1 hypothetical protein CRU87_03250 [Aliarcobacter trophiarum LMG 25534]